MRGGRAWAAFATLDSRILHGRRLTPHPSGESDVDQLYITQKLLGPITIAQNAAFMKNPRFNGYKFGDEILRATQLERKYRAKLTDGSMSCEALDFMKSCLRCAAVRRAARGPLARQCAGLGTRSTTSRAHEPSHPCLLYTSPSPRDS